MTYRFLRHTADLRVEIEAPDLERLLWDATDLMRRLFLGESRMTPAERREITVGGEDEAELVFAYLRELLYGFAVDTFVPALLERATFANGSLSAVVSGERFDPARHEPQPEVKAVTRHGLMVERVDGGWRAEVLFDV